MTLLALVLAAMARADVVSLAPLVPEQPSNVVDPLAPVEGVGVASLGEIKQASGLICVATQRPGSHASNVNTDCDESVGNVAPHNETAIAVNPTNRSAPGSVELPQRALPGRSPSAPHNARVEVRTHFGPVLRPPRAGAR
jgi:hypothetical protein